MRPYLALLAAAAVAASSCDRTPRDPSPRDAEAAGRGAAPPVAARAPTNADALGGTLSISDAVRVFQRDLPPADSLAHASPDQAALVRRLVSAIDRRDTADVRGMLLSRAEFGWLYYPTSAMASPPYELPPQVGWLQLVLESDKGVGRALDRLAGRGLRYGGHRCAKGPTAEGENRVWSRCAVTLRTATGDTTSAVLFGGIVERGGRYKFLNYWNKM
jgi:hypothetical protein